MHEIRIPQAAWKNNFEITHNINFNFKGVCECFVFLLLGWLCKLIF